MMLLLMMMNSLRTHALHKHYLNIGEIGLSGPLIVLQEKLGARLIFNDTVTSCKRSELEINGLIFFFTLKCVAHDA